LLVVRGVLAAWALTPCAATTQALGVAPPRDRHPWALVRAAATPHVYPREALMRAIVW